MVFTWRWQLDHTDQCAGQDLADVLESDRGETGAAGRLFAVVHLHHAVAQRQHREHAPAARVHLASIRSLFSITSSIYIYRAK